MRQLQPDELAARQYGQRQAALRAVRRHRCLREMTRRRTRTLFAVTAASALLIRAGVAVASHRTNSPSDGAVAAALVRYAADTGVDSLVIRSDQTQRGTEALNAARTAAARYDVTVEPDADRAGASDALLLLMGSHGAASAHVTIERPGRGVLLAPWLADPHVYTASRAEVIVATRRGDGLQLWTPANVAFLPPALSQGHDHGAHA